MAALILLPYLFVWTENLSWLTFINFSLITVIAVLGLNVIMGMAGQVSMGHAAFIMVGGYSVGVLTTVSGWSFWAALPAAALITGMTGIMVGAPSVRLRGFYLAVATFAFLFVAQFIIKNMSITGGPHGLTGIPAPAFGDFKIKTDLQWYYLILTIGILAVVASINLTRSRLGRAFFAVRDNDVTAPAMGINVYAVKVTAFFIGSLFAGVAGALNASYLSLVKTDMFTVMDSIWYLGMVIVGGAGSTAGTVMGVLFLKVVGQLLYLIGGGPWARGLGSTFWSSLTSILYGLMLIFFISFQPYGLMSVWRKAKLKYKMWPFGV
jgi:branched-chain amino acid transport system permease protein